jgi:hypothetical protein
LKRLLLLTLGPIIEVNLLLFPELRAAQRAAHLARDCELLDLTLLDMNIWKKQLVLSQAVIGLGGLSIIIYRLNQTSSITTFLDFWLFWGWVFKRLKDRQWRGAWLDETENILGLCERVEVLLRVVSE